MLQWNKNKRFQGVVESPDDISECGFHLVSLLPSGDFTQNIQQFYYGEKKSEYLVL